MRNLLSQVNERLNHIEQLLQALSLVQVQQNIYAPVGAVYGVVENSRVISQQAGADVANMVAGNQFQQVGGSDVE